MLPGEKGYGRRRRKINFIIKLFILHTPFISQFTCLRCRYRSPTHSLVEREILRTGDATSHTLINSIVAFVESDIRDWIRKQSLKHLGANLRWKIHAICIIRETFSTLKRFHHSYAILLVVQFTSIRTERRDSAHLEVLILKATIGIRTKKKKRKVYIIPECNFLCLLVLFPLI